MSIVTLKRKTWSQKNLSGQGVGFSLNGSSRNIGFRDYQMSKSGTPFKGVYPVGHGGGAYFAADVTLNIRDTHCDTMIKPSTVSTRGMLQTKYKWIHGGQYPNYWVKNDDNKELNATQGLYISDKKADNMCVTDTNKPDVYEGNDAKKGPTLCKRTTAGFTFNQLVSNAPYTKTLKQPMPSSQYQLFRMRNCVPILTANKYENYPNNPPNYC